MNRLKDESSPYLLQHKNNPVDWYPWSEEAFDKASQEDKPIFLSIGYSTCHWCHVMEKESFEDEETASLLNDIFVSIKVDREERPDIDHIYMQVCQMINQHGGWPLTVIMFPTKEPFFAATYIPKESKYGRVGLMELIPSVREIWQHGRKDILKSAGLLTESLKKIAAHDSKKEVAPSLIEKTVQELSKRFDEQNGGFSDAPKFPSAHNILFLLRLAYKTKDSENLTRMAEITLENMRRGGVYDHIGYGFHRYSTDEKWLLPHFEKMLYDQAMLSIAYTEYFALTRLRSPRGRKEAFAEVSKQIISYVLRDMKNTEGGFFSAEDADSEGEEGLFYVWEYTELEEALDETQLELVRKVYGVKKEGNFLDEASEKPTQKNIPHLTHDEAKLSQDLSISQEELSTHLNDIRKKLFHIREKRTKPHKDDKILTDWNALMLTALARAAVIFQDETYLQEAENTAKFLLKNMIDEEKRLLHRYRKGEAGITAHLNDYAALIWGLLELYEAGFCLDHLKEAVRLADQMIELFEDKEGAGGFYFTSQDAEKVIVRHKEWYDGALPSGNSTACYSLAKLSQLTGSTLYKEKAFGQVSAAGKIFEASPSAYSFMMMSFNHLLSPGRQIVILCESLDEASEMISEIRRHYDPFQTLLVIEKSLQSEYASLAEFTKDMKMLDGKTTAYVCKDFTCEKPTHSISNPSIS